MADALAAFFTEEREPAAGSAAEAAFVVARGFDDGSCEGGDGAGLLIYVAIAAEVAGIVEDDFFFRWSQKRDLGHSRRISLRG